MAQINFGTSVSLKQTANLIASTPSVRFYLRGEPGIGKTMLLATLKKLLPRHEMIYVDVPNLDLGDISMPVIDRDSKTTTYYPNARFGIHTGKPVCILLDEFSKGADPVKNMLHPILNEGRLGDTLLHPDTIVFLTGNLSSDGVGDAMKAHTKNRITTLTVRKPSAEEWISWGIDNGVEPTLLAFAREFQEIFASYTESSASENPYIYHPKKQQDAFVSPRSLYKASDIVKARGNLDAESVVAAISGTCGESFSRAFHAYLEFSDQLPTKDYVLANPKTAPIPTSPAAQSIIMFGGISWVDKETMTPFMEYVERFPAEWQAVFCINIAKSSKQGMAFQNRKFSEWVAKNQDLL